MKPLKLFFAFSFLLFLFFFYFDILNASNIQSIVHSSREDFSLGSFSDSLDIEIVPGTIRLKEEGGNVDNVDLTLGYSLLRNTKLSNNVVKLGLSSSTYSTVSSPGLAHNTVRHSFLDSNTGYLYVSTNGGLSVINTNTTPQTLVTRYHTGSVPALASNLVRHSFLDSVTGYLYVSTGSGVSVINTNATPQTLVIRYHTGSTPALANNSVNHSFLNANTGYLYVGTNGGGLSVINTNATPQTLVTRYHTASIPALESGWISHSFLDPSTGYLYVSSGEGLSVININATPETLVTRYHTGSTPALADNWTRHSFIDSYTGYLYVGTDGGLSVINTNATPETLVTRYYAGFAPGLAHSWVRHSFFDSHTGSLYVSTDGGLSIINTTTNPQMLVNRYGIGSSPALPNNWVLHSFLDPDTGDLYVSTGGGLSVIKNTYTNVGEYSFSYKVGEIPEKQVILDVTNPENTDVTLQYRSTQSQNVWFDDFVDDSSYTGDFYNWGGGRKFQHVSVSDGILTLSNPTEHTYFYFWFDTGKVADFFPAGSVVQAKVRMNTNKEIGDYFMYWIFTDEWEWDFEETVFNEWVYLSWVPQGPFSELGFHLYLNQNLDSSDSFEIDWLRIASPDDVWSSWSEQCNSLSGCDIDTTGLLEDDWLQFKLNLSTSDNHVTPVVNSLKLPDDFESSGEYLSSVIDSGVNDTVWSSLDFVGSNSLIFYTRTGNSSTPDSNWSNWSLINSPITSPSGRYLQYRVLFSNLVLGEATVLGSVSVSYEEEAESDLSTDLLNEELSISYVEEIESNLTTDPLNGELASVGTNIYPILIISFLLIFSTNRSLLRRKSFLTFDKVR